jgi:hypothetical protein
VQANALLYCTIRIWSAPAALANYTILGYMLGKHVVKHDSKGVSFRASPILLL